MIFENECRRKRALSHLRKNGGNLCQKDSFGSFLIPGFSYKKKMETRKQKCNNLSFAEL